jgi:UDP-N-acetylglucosamine 2-epimerase (non-hydrolysing)
MKVVHVVGARPNFVKAAPVHRALADRGLQQLVVHTGQHYDADMSQVFFRELELPAPDVNLGVGSGSHARQTAEMMKGIEPVLEEYAPQLALVYGDVNSTLAAALVACKLRVPVGHVEAGLRSFDRTMPEEINRILTDQVSDLLFTPSPDADQNLLREGIPSQKIRFVGNVMIDTLVRLLPRARDRDILGTLGLTQKTGSVAPPYALVTLHRPANVDNRDRFAVILTALKALSRSLTVVFPVHPRTRQRFREFGFADDITEVRLTDPVGYLDFLCLQARARAVITDSGGIQEETTWLGVPCFTVRSTTERPITLAEGTNRLVGDQVEALPELVLAAVNRPSGHPCRPKYWDGRAAERIADIILTNFAAP